MRIGEPTVTGGLTADVVRRVLRRHINEVRFCYEIALRSRPTLAGSIGVRLAVLETGATSRVEATSDGPGDPQLTACVLTSHRRWVFPPAEGRPAEVSVTYALSADPP